MSLFSKENINKKKAILSNCLDVYLKHKDVEFEISDDCKIYISVNKSVIDCFLKDIYNFFPELSEDFTFDCENKEGWVTFSYLGLYNAIPCEEVYLVALAYLIEDLGMGEFPEIIKLQLEDMISMEG